MRSFLSALFVSLVLSACGGGDDAPESADVPVTELRQADRDAIQAKVWPAGGRVVQSDAAWTTLWNTPTSRSGVIACDSPATCGAEPKRPEFDFSRYSLIAVFGDLSPGQSIRLASVTQQDGVMHVNTVRKNWPGNYVQIQTPFAIVFLVPKTSARVVVSEGVES